MIRRTGALVISAVLAVALFGALWIGVALQWDWLDAVDQSALDVFARYGAAHPGWVTGWDVYCTVLGPGAFRIATAVVIAVAFVKRHIRLAIFLLVSVELSGVLTEVAKALAGRARPDAAFVWALGSSFPSGHALGVMTAVLALLTVVSPVVRSRWRGVLIVLGVVIVVTIGLGRVVLNVHHPSDVLAGWLLGYAYFVFCLVVVRPAGPSVEADGTPEALGSSR